METTRRPAATEYAPFYATYVDAVPEGDVVQLLRENGRQLADALAPLDEARGGHRYAEGKWSVREVIGHLSDAERVFGYRAMRIARGDATPLASFDEDAYAAAAGSDTRAMSDLLAELAAVRASSVALFASLSSEAWTRLGTASGKSVSVRALAYITLGHAMHHQRILRERYGVGQ